MIKIIFFAALREKLGCEQTSLPFDASMTVAQVITTLTTENPQWQSAFNSSLLCAVNQEMVNKDYLIKSGDEVAFFPPVTGG
ncbi:molybdopterin converting factor subunit 1 [Colwelliaceae bacterium 6441]